MVRKVSDSIEAKAIKLYRKNHRVGDILKRCGIGNTMFYRILKRNKVILRDVSEFKPRVPEKKICGSCGKPFSRMNYNRKLSYKQFFYQKFCSRKCHALSMKGVKRGIVPRSAFKIGVTPWNKDIEWLDMRGKKHPHWKPKVTTKCATCNKVIKLHPYRLRDVKANYCSPRCTVIGQYKSGEFPRQADTKIEKIMREELIKAGFKENEDFFHQYDFFGKFMCDFAFPKQRVIIECQGDFWHANPSKYPYNPDMPEKVLHPIQIKGIKRDKSREAYVKKRGWVFFPVWEEYILDRHNLKVTIDAIKYVIRNRTSRD